MDITGKIENLTKEEKQELANRIYRLVNELNLTIEDALKSGLVPLIQVSDPMTPVARLHAIVYEQSLFQNTSAPKSAAPSGDATPKKESKNPDANDAN